MAANTREDAQGAGKTRNSARQNLMVLRLGGAIGSAESDVANGAVGRLIREAVFRQADVAG